MMIERIQKQYNGSIQLQEPLACNDTNLPEALRTLLNRSNGIMETMVHPETGEQIEIGWIVYPYDEICRSTSYYEKEYGLSGIVFADDGAGNPFFISDGAIYEFDPIDNKSILKANSLEEFFSE